MLLEFIIIFALLFIILGIVYQFLFGIFTWALILSLVFYISYVTVKLVYYFRRRNEQTNPKQQSSSTMQEKDMPALKEFIQKNINEGFKPTIIKEALLKQGWPNEKVEQAFLELKT